MIDKPPIALKEATTDQIVDRLTLDMLQRFHTAGKKPILDKRLEENWLAYRKVPFLPRSVTPTYLRGFPGQGKTTCYRVAAEGVAAMLGLRFVANPSDDYIPKEDELLFIVQELSGQVSAVDFGGIPNVRHFHTADGVEQPFMTKLANKRLVALQHAGAAVLLLDDFSNASPNIQNVALSILMENRFQGLNLGNTLVGATGNLGSNDGTHVNSTSNAIVTRVANFLVVDTVDHWIERTCREYSDELGDGGIAGFLKRYPDLFHVPNARREGVPYPCPRSWSLFVPKLREVLFTYHQLKSKNTEEPFPFDELEFEASGFLGLEVANKLVSYFLSFKQQSDPLALALLQNGAWSEQALATFREHYAQGYAASSQQFGYQFMTALADYTAKAFLNDLPQKNNWQRIANALAAGFYGDRIDHALICYGAHYFALRIILLSSGNEAAMAEFGRLDDKKRPNLNEDFICFIAKTMAGLPIANELINTEGSDQEIRLMDETFCQIVTQFRGYEL